MSRPSVFERALIGVYTRVNRRTPWHRLPFLFSLLNLIALRDQLRAENLIDTRTPGDGGRRPGVAPADATDLQRRFRTADGSYNDLSDPDMGMATTRFARNVALDKARPAEMPDLAAPNAREISQRLMRRDEFTPATSINLLAAAWIQFQTHDWFAHGREEDLTIDIPLPEGDTWFEDPMRIPQTKQDSTRVDGDRDLPPTYINSNSHWWDASSIYGSTEARREQVRSHVDGKLLLKDGHLPLDPTTGVALTGFSENWWVGLGMLHTLFTLEHNAICDALKKDHPHLTEDELFGTAQLVNSALLAKIHTVEWTPAIIAHPVMRVAMRANWWGLAEEKIHRRFGRISRSDIISGIPGSAHDHHGAPYQLTEEFASVYRLHPLLPEQLDVRSLDDNRLLDSMEFQEIILLNAQRVLEGPQEVQDLWYSFGTQHPGAVQLHNFPRWMQDITLPDGVRLDLAALDITRDRERGVPRYNEFRRQLHLKPATTFDELTDNPVWARELEEIYGDVEKVDLQVGMHAETPPKGFGFSDTAFRVFILMASRRLKSDRFLTDCYTEEYYTGTGLRWVADNDMRSVLLRHFPELEKALDGVPNAFVPWNVSGARASDSTPATATAAAGQSD
ncbi:peroxidase family protein [Microbacterium sp. BK668]|uniref:peroxidase family protein n=1 Tax=Microbacterium sp. BK668 TaxID=2512118 RepID=UPI0010D5BE09|nr:peroxidase family protein [Microbacterium sp. BK668]TDN92912.1 heme peroxidase [Microbacterium sp. BK668]